MSQAVIAVNNLNKTVPTAAGDLIILDDVNLELAVELIKNRKKKKKK